MTDAHGWTVREIVPDELESADLERFARLVNVTHHELEPDDPALSNQWMTARYYTRQPSYPHHYLVVERDDDMVGMAEVEFDRSGVNEDIVYVEIQVDPAHRRQGVGTALLHEVSQLGRQESASKIIGWAVHSDEVRGFWESKGLELAYTERGSRLVLADVDRGTMAAWIDQAQPARDKGYRLLRWRGSTPEEHMGVLVDALVGMEDAPLDDLDMTPERTTPEVVRERDARWAAVGSEPWTMVVVDPDGAAAAMTQIIVHRSRPELIWQEGTTTLDAHRRQGIGRWIKAEMMQDILRDAPQALHVETENAESNSSMLNINVAMGFAPHQTYCAYQAPLDQLR